MARPLEVLADLQLAVDGEEVSIQAEGDCIVVDLPNLRTARRLLAAEPLVPARRTRTISKLQQALREAELQAEVRLQGDLIARLGAGIEPGRLGRLLHVPGLELWPTRPLQGAARRRPLSALLVGMGIVLVLGGLVAWSRRT